MFRYAFGSCGHGLAPCSTVHTSIPGVWETQFLLVLQGLQFWHVQALFDGIDFRSSYGTEFENSKTARSILTAELQWLFQKLQPSRLQERLCNSGGNCYEPFGPDNGDLGVCSF